MSTIIKRLIRLFSLFSSTNLEKNPFIYSQSYYRFIMDLFPIKIWRQCTKQLTIIGAIRHCLRLHHLSLIWKRSNYYSGKSVGEHREGEDLIQIISRMPGTKNATIEDIKNIQVLSTVTGEMVPIAQVYRWF